MTNWDSMTSDQLRQRLNDEKEREQEHERYIHLIENLRRCVLALGMTETARIHIEASSTTDTSPGALGVKKQTLYPPPYSPRDNNMAIKLIQFTRDAIISELEDMDTTIEDSGKPNDS